MAGGQQKGAKKVVATPTPTPAPTPVAPVVEFQAVALRESAERDRESTIFLFVSNKSDKALTGLSLDIPEDVFGTVKPPDFSAGVPPFGSVRQNLVVRPTAQADYAAHKILLTLSYKWNAGGREVTSAQTTTVSLGVKRRFEEEAKGFPGGTAAFLYLLLPVIPAVLSYRLADGLRKGNGLTKPTFGTEDIVPAFLIAVVLNLLVLLLGKIGWGVAYSDPLTFVGVLAGSFLCGVAVPFYFWRRELREFRCWGFKNNDTREEYLRKALLSPHAPGTFTWATGTVNGETWQGILLKQPNGTPVLGAQLQVSPPKTGDQKKDKAAFELIDENIHDRQSLADMLKNRKLLVVGFMAKVKRGETGQDTVIVTDEVKGFEQTGGVVKPLVILVS